MIPCPGALVVLLERSCVQRIAFGLLLIVAFSVGFAAVLVGVGLLLVSAAASSNAGVGKDGGEPICHFSLLW